MTVRGQSSLGLGWAPVVSSNSRELSEFPALSGYGIVGSLGWELQSSSGPCKEQGQLHLERVAQVEHFQGNTKRSRLGTAGDGKDPKAEPQRSPGAVGVTFPRGSGDTRAASSGEGDWENILQPFFQLEIFPWSWNQVRFPLKRAKSMDIPAWCCSCRASIPPGPAGPQT